MQKDIEIQQKKIALENSKLIQKAEEFQKNLKDVEEQTRKRKLKK